MTQIREILLVIDMQPGYIDSCDKYSQAARNCGILLRQAVAAKRYIILVETSIESQLPTCEFLRKEVAEYPDVGIVSKTSSTSGGAKEIIQHLSDKDISYTRSKFLVCGVYFPGCVSAVVRGLWMERGQNISIIANACDSMFSIKEGRYGTDEAAASFRNVYGVSVDDRRF